MKQPVTITCGKLSENVYDYNGWSLIRKYVLMFQSLRIFTLKYIERMRIAQCVALKSFDERCFNILRNNSWFHMIIEKVYRLVYIFICSKRNVILSRRKFNSWNIWQKYLIIYQKTRRISVTIVVFKKSVISKLLQIPNSRWDFFSWLRNE